MEKLLDYFRPEKYILDLTVDKFAKTIGGVVIVSGEVLNGTVKFHAVGLEITDVLVNGSKQEFRADGEILEVPAVSLGKAEITIYYNGKLNENMEGAYLSTYEYEGRQEIIVATQFESHYAREAFPCIDEPAAKAVFGLTITTPNEDDIVLSNMPEVFEKHHLGHAPGRSPKSTVLDGGFSKTFQPTPRMSTYLLAWVIGKFHGKTIKNAHGVEITTYAALNQELATVDFANEVAAKSLEFYDDNFGVPYPLKKLDQVALPDFEAGAMENWGLVTYRESMMLVPKNATLSTKKSVALTVAHELSHQWFGDLVTMEWWDDLWLNESFASVMEYYAVDAIYPEYKIFEGFLTGDCYLALMRDAYSGVQSVHQEVHDPAEIATLFDSAIVYAKGARLMLMVVRAMGWKNFCKGISEYFEKYQYKNTVGDDLWQVLSRYADFDVKKMMHAFIDKPGYPVIMNNKSQKRFLVDGSLVDESWPIPEILEDMSGHYVINLADAEFAEKLEKFDELGLEEKIRLLIDRSLISKTDLADSASLLPLVMKFQNEDSAAIWGIVLSIVSTLKIFFEPGSESEKRFKKFVGRLIALKLEEIGLVTRKDDDENVIRLRTILLGLDFYAETESNLRELAGMYDEDYAKLDAEIREDILDAKLYFEPSVIDDYLKTYQEIAEPELKFELLFAGTLSKNDEVLDKMMALLEQPEIVKPQDQPHLFVYLYRNPRIRMKVFEWMTQHWEDVKQMVGDKSLDDYPRYTANVARTEAEYKAWCKFFEPKRDDAALARAIQVGKKEIEAKLKLIRDDKDGVLKALDDFE